MFVLKAISKSVFNFSITINNEMLIFFNLFNRFSAMRFFRRFDLFNIKESNERTKIFILYKKKVDKMRSVNWKFSNESKSFENDDWKASIIVEKKNRKFHLSQMKYDHWLILKFSTIFQNSRMTSKRMKKMLVNDSMQMKKKNLLFCLYNRKIAFVWDFSEIDQIKFEIILFMKIWIVFYEIWQVVDFFIFKTFQRTIIKMLREKMNAELFEKCYNSYRTFWFLIKKSNKYRMINAALNINRVTIRNTNLFFQINTFVKEFDDMQITSLINFLSKYDQFLFFH